VQLNAVTLTRQRWIVLVVSTLSVLVIASASWFTLVTYDVDVEALVVVAVAAVAWVYSRRIALVFASFAVVVATTSCAVAGGHSPIQVAVEATTHVTEFWSVALLVSLLATTMAERTHDAHFDSLTELVNAKRFREFVDLELARAKRYAHPTTVGFVDIDNFKRINDKYGHRTGDEALQHLATVMRQRVRSTDTVGRLGGDEFGILMPETSEGEARVILDRVRMGVHELAAERSWPVAASIGGTTVAARSSVTSDEVLEHADRVMYGVKSGSGDDVMVRALD